MIVSSKAPPALSRSKAPDTTAHRGSGRNAGPHRGCNGARAHSAPCRRGTSSLVGKLDHTIVVREGSTQDRIVQLHFESTGIRDRAMHGEGTAEHGGARRERIAA